MASRFKQQIDALWKIHDRVIKHEDDEHRAIANEIVKVVEGLEKIEGDIQGVRRTLEAVTDYNG